MTTVVMAVRQKKKKLQRKNKTTGKSAHLLVKLLLTATLGPFPHPNTNKFAKRVHHWGQTTKKWACS